MSRRFDTAELLRVAVADEQSGIELYMKLSDKTENAVLKEMFVKLSEMEEVHREMFEDMSKFLEGEESTGVYPDEYVDYLETLSAEGGSSNAYSRIGECKTDTDLLDLAMQFERDQLALQKDMADLLGDKHEKVIEQVIREERDHLVQLARAKKAIGT